MGDTAEEPSTRRSGRSETGRGTAGHEESGRGEMRARPHSLTAQVVEFIEDLCVNPDVTPGDQLPPEGELATRFGVSRVVLREAMKTLEARGLVQRRQGKPAVVASPNAIPVEKFVALAVLRDKHAVMEFTEIRKALEVHGARLAARRIAGPEEPETRPHLTRAREAIAEQRANPLDMPTRLRTDVAFHQALVAAAGNISLTQILDALEQSLGESREQSHHRYLAAGGDPAGSATEHEELLDAVVTGDPAQAVAAMEHHLQVTLHEIETRPETGEEGAGTTDDR